MLTLKVMRIRDDAIFPRYANNTDSGLDLFACESLEIKPFEIQLVHTGIAIELPRKTEAQIRSKSGLALNNGLIVLNSPGTIDQGYRGEIGVILINLGHENFSISNGMNIAQLVVSSINRVLLVSSLTLKKSKRGSSGFGSTNYFQEEKN